MRLSPSYRQAAQQELAALQAAPLEAAQDGAEADPASPSDLRFDEGPLDEGPPMDRPPRFVDAASPLNADWWGAFAGARARALVRAQLKTDAVAVDQVLGLELVRKLVNQVAQDPRLLSLVREAIVALEPSLLRLAMVDPLFFSDEGHPGRQLIERVAQRSFLYNDDANPDFAEFFNPIARAFNQLNNEQIDSAKPFGLALAGLEYAWDEQDQQLAAGRRSVLAALRFAEERQERADRIAFDMSARSDLANVPALVLDFLFGPWSLAMAHARLSDQRNQVDPEGFGSVVPDLLWSVKREVTLQRPAKLFEMIPGMLGKIHSGLSLLGQTPQESATFFDQLMALHQPVLKLRRLKTQRDAEASGQMPLDGGVALSDSGVGELTESDLAPLDGSAAAPARVLRAQAAKLPWLAKNELDMAGFEDTVPTAPGELAADSLAPDEDDDEDGDGDGDGVGDDHDPQDHDPQDHDPQGHDPQGADALQAALLQAEATDAGAPPERATLAAAAAGDNAPPLPPPYLSREDADAVMAQLRTGAWVDLCSRRHWLRAQLVWASTKGTLYMFISHGGQPHSMTRRSCEKLITQRLLRPVDTHAVVAQALERVTARSA